MHTSKDFKWRHYQGEIILLCVRWYLRYRLSYRDLEEMMQERGLFLDHTTIYRWVQFYSLEIQKKASHFLRKPNDSWRLDEIYIKIKGKWHYLYRAVDSNGDIIDFYLSKTRSGKAAKCFLNKMIRLYRTSEPRAIVTDHHPSYQAALKEMRIKGLYVNTKQRKNRYLNNIIEQDHRRVKWKNRHALGYYSYKTAYNTIRGIETMHMLFKGQLYHLDGKRAVVVKNFIQRQFGLSGPILAAA